MRMNARMGKVLAAVSAVVVAALLVARGPLRLQGQAEGPAERPPVDNGQARRMVEAKIANLRCPILGTALDGERVPERMTRYWNGMKIGFSSGSCLLTWDRLNDQEKQKRLEGIMR